MEQPTFGELEYESKKRKTRREIFLERMDWSDSVASAGSAYPAALSQGGTRPAAVSVVGDAAHLLCAVVLQPERSGHGGYALRGRVGADGLWGCGCRVRCRTRRRILNFRHLLARHELGSVLLEEINRHLESQGVRLREGTIIDASIIEAPSTTKNRAGRRDPEMHQTKKGNQWHFGMKLHIGADAETGIVHSVATTAANVHDVTVASRLLHGGEKEVWGDAGYQGVAKRAEMRALDVEWHVALRPGRRRQLPSESEEALAEKRKASGQSKGGASVPAGEAGASAMPRCAIAALAKNTQRLTFLLGLANLMTAERHLAV